MNIYIPEWVCWTAGGAAVLVIGLFVGITVAAGVAEGDQGIEAMLREPYPDPRQRHGGERGGMAEESSQPTPLPPSA